jgi:hypothetical protein
MRIATLAAFGLLAALSVPAAAENGPVVVELYTSQGCSSCPPADELLRELAGRGDVIALALHVDYWDYLGWADEFASPAFTRRQKAYARATGARTVYTPQMVVQGMDHLVGVRPMELADLIDTHEGQDSGVQIKASRTGGTVVIQLHSDAPLGRDAVVQVVRYLPEATVKIERGENRGRSLVYANIVRNWEAVGTWDGSSDLRVSADAGDGPVAVIVQEEGPGRILAAAKLR